MKYLNLIFHRIYVAHVGAEARLFSACGTGITFVIGSPIYAWTSYEFVHWISPCIRTTILIANVVTIYLSVFNRLADGTLDACGLVSFRARRTDLDS